MAAIDTSGLTLNPIEVQSISDFIVERVYRRPVFEAIHGRFEEGVNVKQQIVFATQFGKMGLKKAASCTLQTSGAQSVLTEKYWDPKGIEDALIVCQADIDALFKAYYSKIRNYRELYDITGSDLEIFYAILIEEAIVNTIWRAAWFGDTAVAQSGAGTAGLILAADVKFYDYLDGLWKQIFAAVTATTVKRVTITQNAITTSKANQLALAAGAAKTYFRAVKDLADSRLRSDPRAQFLVTRELFDNYKQGLEDAGAAYDVTLTTEGLQTIRYDGNDIVNMETIWGLSSREDFENNSTDNVYYLPHRIVFTVPENIPLGTLNSGDFDALDQWFSKDDQQNKTKIGFTLDAKLLEEYMITVAY